MLTASIANSQRKAAGAAIPQDYIAYWSMDNISGSILVDEAGNFDGTINGASSVAGLGGDCLSFDGVNDTVTFAGTKPTLTALTGLTLSFWLYWASEANYDSFGGVIGNVSSDTNNYKGFQIRAPGSNIQWFGFGDNQGVSATPPKDQWVHVLGTWDGSKIELNIGGASQGVLTTTGNDMNTGKELIFGKLTYANLYTGFKIDHARLYDYKVSSEQASGLANEF